MKHSCFTKFLRFRSSQPNIGHFITAFLTLPLQNLVHGLNLMPMRNVIIMVFRNTYLLPIMNQDGLNSVHDQFWAEKTSFIDQNRVPNINDHLVKIFRFCCHFSVFFQYYSWWCDAHFDKLYFPNTIQLSKDPLTNIWSCKQWWPWIPGSFDQHVFISRSSVSIHSY